ncbi:MAG: HAD family phosphatase [Alphaproteobacteria bacterium]|nr:HAD family phosphatase [Alphaproteobacteria bacterium]
MLLIFNCDGVVIDSILLHAQAESEAYAEHGINIKPAELIKRFSGVSQDAVNEILEQETGLRMPEDFSVKLEHRKERVFAGQLRPIEGIRYVLDDELWDIPRCIASSTSIELLKKALRMTEIYDLFAPHIFSSDVVTKDKPFPDLFLYASYHMKSELGECIVIEDGEAGIKAGKDAGMKVLGFTGGSHCDETHADRLIAAGADHVFSKMVDLPAVLNGLLNDHFSRLSAL